jgi:hypothetical protein
VSAHYRAGETFRCVKREIDISGNGVGPECGADVLMHGYHWCAQVCPKCLAIYRDNRGEIVRDFAAFWDGATRLRVVDNIARHGGQYVPEF